MNFSRPWCGNIRESVNQSYFAAYLFSLLDFEMSRFVNTTLNTFEFAALIFIFQIGHTHNTPRTHAHAFYRGCTFSNHIFLANYLVVLLIIFFDSCFLENSHSHKASLPSLPPWRRHLFFPLPVIGPALTAWFCGANLPNCHSLFQTRILEAWTKNWYNVLPRRGGCEDIFSFKLLAFFVIITIIPMSLS